MMNTSSHTPVSATPATSSHHTRRITLHEWVTVAVLAAAMGVAYWAWTLVYNVAAPALLKPLGIKRALDGFWLMAPVFFGYVMRKPGLALFGSLVAAAVEGLITQWGMSAVVYGLIQGLGAELVFAVFAYRNWSLPVLMLAASVSAVFSYTYDFLTNAQQHLALWFHLSQIGVFVLSAWVFGAYLARFIARRLLKTGLLDGFAIARDSAH